MYGVGSTEFVIIIGIALVLFGPTLIAFWLGYTLGKKRGDEAPATEAPIAPGTQALPHSEDATEETDGD